MVDASGTRTLAYNAYGELESDSLSVDGDTHLITELRDAFRRSIGYTYAKNGAVQQTVHTGYACDSIGNREFALEGEDSGVCTANVLNQYTCIDS